MCKEIYVTTEAAPKYYMDDKNKKCNKLMGEILGYVFPTPTET